MPLASWVMVSRRRPDPAALLKLKTPLAIAAVLAMVCLIPSLTSAQGFQQGFDFRNSSTFVTDPPGDSYVLATTTYPTTVNGVTFGWTTPYLVQGRDRNKMVDPRLAGINFATNGMPATFYVDLPSAGTYNVSLALGDAGYEGCWVQCQIQFLDGGTVLATVTGGFTKLGYFYDAKGNNWSAAAWPTSNLSQQVTLTGTRLTVVVGTSQATGDSTPIAFLGVAQVSGSPNFAISASPSSLTVQQGNQGSSTITTTISGGFNSAISLSAAGVPSGTTVSFNPNPIPAPGAGSSTMTITVGGSTPVGTYPITVTGNGGGIQRNTTVTLTVSASSGWAAGFDFRNSAGYVTDPPGDSYVLSTTAYPTKSNGVTFGWLKTSLVQSRDRNAKLDPRLAGINFAVNGMPATFYVDLPSAGAYNLSLALGDAGYQACWVQCQIQFLDGNTVLATVTKGSTNMGYFYDAQGNNWSAAAWPTSNVSRQVTLAGTRLTVVVGTSKPAGDSTPIAFLGVAQVSGSPNFAISASPSSLTIQQGNQGSSTITTTISGGFSSAISLSAAGVPSGTTVSFNPNPIPAPGAGSSSMTITVGGSTPVGTYPITVTGNGGGIQQNTTVTLTVTAQQQPNFAISASPSSLTVQQGNQGNSTITTTISGGFNSAISLSAAGVPSGTTVSFNPNPIPAPGAGSSGMTITVGGSTPVGTYPITVTGNGGGIQQNTTVTLTVTAQQQPNFTISASPASLTVQQGNQGNSTITTTISGGFNSAISLSAAGVPSGTTVSFNPNPIPAPGAGNSTMTITVGGSTPVGTYPITVTGNGGGIQRNTTVTLTVTSSSGWAVGFDFRNSAGFVKDPPGASGVTLTSIFPTEGELATYGWSYTATIGARDRNRSIDPRLAGMNYVNNGTPGAFYVDLPGPGTYNLSLAMGDAGYPQCGTRCQVQFLDGNNILATVSKGPTNLGYFYDMQGNNWSASAWPASNVSQQVTLVGTQLTVLVGTNQYTGDITPIAYVGVAQVSAGPTFALQAPASVSVGQGQYSTANVFTVLIGGFNNAVNLSASGAPAGTTVTFNPSTIPAPGAGTSIMTINVPQGTPLGNYPLTVTAKGGGIVQNATVVLTVTVAGAPAFTLTAPSAANTGSGGQATGTVSTAISDGFNSAVSLSATGEPDGTTVSFNPGTIPAPGAGSSTMTITVPQGTAFGSYPITVKASSVQGNQTATTTLTVSGSGKVNLPAGTGWVPLSSGASFCNASPGHMYFNPEVGAVDAADFLGGCIGGQMVAYSGGAADTANDRYFLWTSGHNNYQGNEMYVLDLQGASPSVARVTDPAWTVDNADVPPDCACKGTNNCGQGLWHDGAGHLVSNPYSESGYGGPLFESTPAPDGSHGQPSCGYGARFTPNAREIYAGMVYNAPANKLFTWGGEAAANPTGLMNSTWTLDLNQNPAKWSRLKDFAYPWFTAAVFDYTANHPTSGYDLVFGEGQTLYAYSPSTDTYTVLSSTLPDIGYNVNVELDPVHHYLVMENGDIWGGYHLKTVDIDSCNGNNCKVTNLDNTASCKGALGYWAGMAWDSKRKVMSIFPSSTNCVGAACTPPFNTVYLLNPDPSNTVTITYQGVQRTIQPQQCFAASYGPTPPTSSGPGVYSRFKYYPNEDVYLYIPFPTNPWILRLEQ